MTDEQLSRLPSYCVIVRCIWERNANQLQALAELNRRGLWLSAEQKEQAQLPKQFRTCPRP